MSVTLFFILFLRMPNKKKRKPANATVTNTAAAYATVVANTTATDATQVSATYDSKESKAQKLESLRSELRKKISGFKGNRTTNHIKEQNSSAFVNDPMTNAVRSSSGGVVAMTRDQRKKMRQQQIQAQASLQKLKDMGINPDEIMASLSAEDKERYKNQFLKSSESFDAALQRFDSVIESEASKNVNVEDIATTSSTTTMSSTLPKKSDLETVMFAPVKEDQIINPSADELKKATEQGLPIMERTEFVL